MNARVTQQDVARHLGVGRSTVSMALRGNLRISTEMRARVHAAAEELGYVPDPALAALAVYREEKRRRSSSGSRLAFVYPSHYPKRSASPAFPLVHGIGNRAAQLGYGLEFFQTNFETKDLRNVLRVLSARGIEGAFFNSPSKPILEYRLDWSRVAVVVVGNIAHAAGFPQVTSDWLRGACEAVGMLGQYGYRRPGLVISMVEATGARHLIEYGFIEGCRQALGLAAPAVFRHTSGRVPLSQDRLVEWVRREQIDVVVDAARVLYGLREMLAKRTEAAIVSLNLFEERDDGFAGVKLNRYEMGRRATDLLHSFISHRQFGLQDLPPTWMVPSTWMDGTM